MYETDFSHPIWSFAFSRGVNASFSSLPGDPWVDAVFLLEQPDGDGQSGRGRGGAESRRESVGHVGNESVNFECNLLVS